MKKLPRPTIIIYFLRNMYSVWELEFRNLFAFREELSGIDSRNASNPLADTFVRFFFIVHTCGKGYCVYLNDVHFLSRLVCAFRFNAKTMRILRNFSVWPLQCRMSLVFRVLRKKSHNCLQHRHRTTHTFLSLAGFSASNQYAELWACEFAREGGVLSVCLMKSK